MCGLPGFFVAKCLCEVCIAILYYRQINVSSETLENAEEGTQLHIRLAILNTRDISLLCADFFGELLLCQAGTATLLFQSFCKAESPGLVIELFTLLRAFCPMFHFKQLVKGAA